MFIEGKFTSLNEYIKAERTNRYAGAKIKKTMTELAYLQCLNKPKFETPTTIRFIWHVKNKRVDPDNTAFAKKFCLDGMVKAQIIPDDTFKHIKGFVDEFIVSDKEGVEVVAID